MEGACAVVAVRIPLTKDTEGFAQQDLFSEEQGANDVGRTGKKETGYANANYKANCQRCGLLFTSWSPYPLIWHLEDHILMNHALECAFCDFVAFDFSDLSLHVVREHRKDEKTTVEKTETWEETANRWESEAEECNSKLDFLQGEEQMLQKPGVSRRGFTGKKTNWLKDEDLKKEPTKVIILDARADGGDKVIVKLDLGAGVIVFDTWRSTNPNFALAIDELGEDETKWKKVEMEMFLEFDEFADRSWRRIRFPRRAKK